MFRVGGDAKMITLPVLMQLESWTQSEVVGTLKPYKYMCLFMPLLIPADALVVRGCEDTKRFTLFINTVGRYNQKVGGGGGIRWIFRQCSLPK